MFFGEYQHSLDAKGRLIMPAKFRTELGPKFYLTRGLDGCLFGYTAQGWELLQAKLQTLPLARKEARTFMRFFYAAALECEFDKQGRIKLSPTLIDYAALDDKCMIIGVANRIEIWSNERWQEQNAAALTKFDELAEDLLDFGL